MVDTSTVTGRRGVACAIVLILVAAAGAPRADVYRWVDEKGVEHFSNAPSDVGGPAGTEALPESAKRLTGATTGAGGGKDGGSPETAAAADAGGAAGGSVPGIGNAGDSGSVANVLARERLEREQRKAKARLVALDHELEMLAAARQAHALLKRESTGGIVNPDASVKSDQEKALDDERATLTSRLADIQKQLAAAPAP
jgi:hypothetical protein